MNFSWRYVLHKIPLYWTNTTGMTHLKNISLRTLLISRPSTRCAIVIGTSLSLILNSANWGEGRVWRRGEEGPHHTAAQGDYPIVVIRWLRLTEVGLYLISHNKKKRKVNLIGHTFRWNCLVKHVIERNIEGKIEVRGKRGGRRKQLTDDLKETRGYCNLKEEALDRCLWRTRFGRVCGPVARQNTKWMNQLYLSGKYGKCTGYAAITSSVYFKLNSCWTFFNLRIWYNYIHRQNTSWHWLMQSPGFKT